MSSDTLLTKYRPFTFTEVLGNEYAVKALAAACSETKHPHTYLFTGPSGVGKTTLARITAKFFNADIMEIDAATNSGVDSMRQLVEATAFTPVSGNPKMVIIDECHALSKNAFQALLKTLEDGPSSYYFSLCTTELSKVPDSIRTRCYNVVLKTLKIQEIEDLVSTVAELEGWVLNNDVFQGITIAATGQPRKALTILQAGHGAQSKDELAAIVSEVERDSEPLVELCRFLVAGGKDWGRISGLLSKLQDDEESLSQASRYLTTSILNGTEAGAKNSWRILDALLFPRSGFDRRAQLVAAIGSVIWQS